MQCFTCSRVETESQKLLYCTRCKSAAYCSAACQREDWRAHKKICQLFNEGIAGQMTHPDHLKVKEVTLKAAARYDEYSPLHRLIWKTFEKKAGKSDEAVLRDMRKLFLLRPELRGARAEIIRNELLFDLIPKMLSSPRSIPMEAFRKPSSPFLILLGKLGPNICSDTFSSETSTPLHWIVETGYDVRSMQIQLILAQQVIDAGAFVNKKSLQLQYTPLHKASTSWGIVNLDLIKLLLDNGADPNAQDNLGHTPLMYTMSTAGRAAKFILEYDGQVKVDVNVRTHAGGTMLGLVRWCIEEAQELIAHTSPSLEGKIRKYHYNLEQLEEVEKILLGKGAIDGGWDTEAEKRMQPE